MEHIAQDGSNENESVRLNLHSNRMYTHMFVYVYIISSHTCLPNNIKSSKMQRDEKN